MFHKDTIRLIKKTFNRFFSLVMIVLIGVAFMMGLLATPDIMRQSIDYYNDNNNLQDFQLYSSFGFCNEDVIRLRKQDFVESVFASKSLDCLMVTEKGTSNVIRVEESDRYVNNYEIIDGRDVENKDEIVLLVSSVAQRSYIIGDRVTLFNEEDDLDDSLKNTEYTIVGLAQSPAYLSKVLGSSNYKNMDLNTIGFIRSSNFIGKYYTTIYLTVNDAKKLTAYTDKYNKFIADTKNDLENFAISQQDYNKDTIILEIREEIENGEKELATQKKDAQDKLDEAKAQLDEAHMQLIVAENQITQYKQMYNTINNEINSTSKTITRRIEENDQAIQEVEETTGKSFNEYYIEVSADYTSYTSLKNLSNQDNNQIVSDALIRVTNENERLANQNVTNQATIDLNNSRIVEIDGLLISETNQESITNLNDEKARLQRENVTLQLAISSNNSIINSNEETIKQLQSIIDGNPDESIANQINTYNNKYNGSIEDEYAKISAIEEDRILLASSKEALNTSKEALKYVENMLVTATNEYNSGKKMYEEGLKEYNKGVLEFTEEIEKAEAEIQKGYQALEELPEAKWMILDRDMHYSSLMYTNTVKQMTSICIAMPILFYLVAALVCMTTMTRLVDEQRGQIGIFRALGFSKEQVTSKYVIYALLAALIGSVIGIGIGIVSFPVVIYYTWGLMYIIPPIRMSIPLIPLIICVLAFSLLMMGVTYIVVQGSLKELPAQLLRPKAPKNAKKVFLEYIPFIWNKLSFTSKITARNLIRYKTRFFMTVIGVAGCTGLLVVGWGIKDSISDIINVQFGQLINYNYTINVENDYNIFESVDYLKEDLNNIYVVPFNSYTSKVYTEDGHENTLTVEVFDARESRDVLNLHLTDRKTDVEINNNGVLVSEKFALNNNIKKGDIITIESANGVKAKVKVNDIIEMYFQHYIYMSSDYYYNTFNQKVHNTNIAIKTDNSKADIAKEASNLEGYLSIVDFSSMIDQFQTMIEALDLIILVIIITAGSLSFVVLINLTQVNISERIREIATLKVLGFRTGEVNSYIFKEIFLLTIIGAIIGLPLGVVEHHFIMGVINMDMVMFGNNVSLLTFTYAFVVTMVFTCIVLIIMKKPLKNIEMIESLKSVE